MSLILGDRIRQTSTTTGSGTLTLDGLVTGFQSFAAIGNGNTTYYTIALDAQWEVGIGTYSAGTLARDAVISSSTGSKIVFDVGAKDVFVTLPSEKAVTSGTDAVLTKLTTPTVQATNSGGLSLKNSAGTTQISMGGGGGDNVSVNVSTNMNGSNAQIDISPTGTGHVHMKPSGTGSIEVAPTNVGTIDNMTIGATTPKAVTGTTITATSFSGSGSGLTSIPNSALTNSSITINGASTSLGGSVNVGTVTSASVVSANGFAGTVATGTTTPAITLSTSITGVLKGNGTAISAASAGTDYQAPITLTTTGTSGAATFVANTLNIPQYSGGGGSGTVTSVNATVPAFLSVTGGPITTSGTLAISYSGTALPIANGGTGETTQQAALNALAGSVQNSRFLAGNGTNVTMRAIAVGDVPTLNQDTTGTAANVTGVVAIANGGTGTTTPALVAGTNVTITGTWPNQTIAASSGGSVTISNDTVTTSNLYPAFLAATSGTASTIYTGNAKLLYKPSTGELQSTILTGTVNAPNTFGFKNRIINGAMVIDQRNAGASVTPANGIFTLDRWCSFQSLAGKFSVQQNAGSVALPVGFSNYLGVTSLSAYSIGTSDYYLQQQRIEGFNFADCGWGTANAATVTLSFWVRSSLTGTFGGSFVNSADNRSYPFAYTINSANTWEFETIVILGDTSGTWLGATNGAGVKINFSLGVGSALSATAGAWVAGNYLSSTGSTSIVGTNAATFYITGVQLEKSNISTSFDYRSYGTELGLCLRYYQTLPGIIVNTSGSWASITYVAPMRANPTASGGGIGFTIDSASIYVGNFYQNSRAVQTIALSAEL